MKGHETAGINPHRYMPQRNTPVPHHPALQRDRPPVLYIFGITSVTNSAGHVTFTPAAILPRNAYAKVTSEVQPY